MFSDSDAGGDSGDGDDSGEDNCNDRPRSTTNNNEQTTIIIIYTTKIGTFVCPPHISETVAVRIMKRAHRPRIASTTNKLIFKTNFTVHFINYILNN